MKALLSGQPSRRLKREAVSRVREWSEFMELKEFVKKTLDDIIQGIQAVQAASGGATINPPVMQHGSNPDTFKATGRLWDSSDHRLIEQVRSDVAVTAEEQTKMEGGFNAGIQVLGIGGEAGIDNNSLNSTVSRIQFSVPIRYPFSKTTKL
jgi:hypothetical protein